jgi:hypothetical protein
VFAEIIERFCDDLKIVFVDNIAWVSGLDHVHEVALISQDYCHPLHLRYMLPCRRFEPTDPLCGAATIALGLRPVEAGRNIEPLTKPS